MTTKTCRYHCRACGGHFTSLDAFDAHKPHNTAEGGCGWPEDGKLVPAGRGECRISSGETHSADLYEHRNAQAVRERFAA